jgi:hypothetical protein
VLTSLTAAALGISIAALDASAAVAAPGDPVRPTIVVTEMFIGYGMVSITGKARPGAMVDLHEAAYVDRTDIDKAGQTWFDHLDEPDIISAPAGSDGRFELRRMLDSGFVFAVKADGLMSGTATVRVQVLTELDLTTDPGTGNVTAIVRASPGQPGLSVQLQRSTAGSWTTVAEGYIGDGGGQSFRLTGQPSGLQSYRAKVGGDRDNALTASDWAPADIVVGGTTPSRGGASGQTGPTPGIAPTTPVPDEPSTPTTPTKPTTPTTPTEPTTPKPTTPKPTTPKPTTPKPTTPATAVGAVQLTKIVYDSPGKDTGTNTSLNGEYVRLTNRTKNAINLRNWTLRDAAGRVYTFTTDHSLGAGKNVYVLTGKGTNGTPAAHRYWGSKSYVWNNSGDTAYLRDATKKTIDSCRWTKDSNVTYC